MDNKIISNHTLEDYKKKYRNRNYKLLKFTKKEIEAFDKKNPTKNKGYLLRGRRWWLIGDTYYEIPKPFTFTWFRNLNKAIQIGTCVLAAGVIASAVAVPVVIINSKNNVLNREAIIDSKLQDDASITLKQTSEEGNVYTISPKTSEKIVTGIESVYIGESSLKHNDEYTYEQSNKSIDLTIKKIAFNNHKGIVKVLPKLQVDPTGKHLIKFLNYDGAELQSDFVKDGETPVYKGSTPTKDPEPEKYTYKFTGWDKEIVPATEDTSYTATFELSECLITFTDESGKEWQKGKQQVGKVATYSGEIPTKDPSESQVFTFSGWDKDLAIVTDVDTYTAQFDASIRKYTVTFVDDNGTILQTDEVDYGTIPSAPTDPTKVPDENYDYAFNGWDKAIVAVTGDTTYTATYKHTACNIKFVNYDGSILQEGKVAVGSKPVYSGNEPQREQSESIVYKFSGWDKEIAAVTDIATYTAQFSELARQYTITFVDGDGKTLESKKVDYGEKPTYTGSTPTKTSDTNYDYAWNNKWDKELSAVTGDTTYTAQFDKSACLIKFVNDNGSVLQETKQPTGQLAAYSGSTPTKDPTESQVFTFSGWDKDLAVVTDIATYTAQFSESVRKYTITFYDEDGSTVLQSSKVEYNTVPQYTGSTPTKASDTDYDYVFDKWDKTPVAVTCDASYIAQYKHSACLIKFVNDDGATEVETPKKVAVGETPTCSTTPTKTPTAEYSYTFNGWSPAVVAVTDVATYTATYTSTKRKYSVTAQSLDTSKGSVEYPQSQVEYGANATVKATPITGNKFVGWYDNAQGTGSAVSTEATYTFTVTGTTNLYAKFDVDSITLTLVSDPSDVGTTLTGGGSYSPGTKVTISATKVDDYTFLGWYDGTTKLSTSLSYEYTTGSSAKTLTAKFEESELTADIIGSPLYGQEESEKAKLVVTYEGKDVTSECEFGYEEYDDVISIDNNGVVTSLTEDEHDWASVKITYNSKEVEEFWVPYNMFKVIDDTVELGEARYVRPYLYDDDWETCAPQCVFDTFGDDRIDFDNEVGKVYCKDYDNKYTVRTKITCDPDYGGENLNNYVDVRVNIEKVLLDYDTSEASGVEIVDGAPKALIEGNNLVFKINNETGGEINPKIIIYDNDMESEIYNNDEMTFDEGEKPVTVLSKDIMWSDVFNVDNCTVKIIL